MAQQTINIGSAPDDGTGDTLRDGGDKINDNFTELYTDKADKAGGTFTGDIIVPDEAYDATAWNGSLEVPTKNAVRDKIESLGSGITELDDVPDVNAPTPTNGDVLTWDSTPGEWVAAAPSGGIAELDDVPDVNAPTPSNGDVLTWDSTPGEWVAAAPSGGSGDFVYVGRTPVSAVTNVDIPLSSSYDSFYIEFYLTPGTDNVNLNASITDDNFSTVEAGATDYAYTSLRSTASSTGVTSSNGTTIIQVVNAGQGNAAGEFMSGNIQVINAKESGAPTTIIFDQNYINSSAGAYGQSRTMASYRQNSVIDGLRLTFSSGTATGFFKIWGRTT